jgi:murein DD-endopeptidase MepM/ murein hydrolase activator NlpD
MNMRSAIVIVGLLGVLCAAGCTPLSDHPNQDEAASAASVTPTATLVLAGLDDPSGQVEIIETPAVPHDAQPLRFTFPTPIPNPETSWRPPLYKVPLALSPNDHFYFTRPIAADEVNWPLADYRYGYFFPNTEVVHTGVDIDAPRGTPVLAAAAGKVVWAGYGLLHGDNDSNDPYGKAVAVRHAFGYEGRLVTTIYAHMDQVDVVVGQRVETGDQLGIVGTTGNTTGPHLHFEVRLESNTYFATRNPELWLAPPEGMGVLAARLMNTNGSYLTGQDIRLRSLANDKIFEIRSYAPTLVWSDDYYQENLVLGSLPAGDYQISIDYLDHTYKQSITIHPGAVAYFSFRGERGYSLKLPQPASDMNWMPEP